MDIDKIIEKRKSVRSFNTKKVSWEKVLDAIDAANQGNFAGNINNLRYIIVEDKKLIGDIAKHAHQTWISNAGIVIVVCSDDKNLENMYGERGRIYSRQQAGAAINTMILKLVDAGLCTCWVGAYTDEFVRNTLKIPAHIQVEAIIPVGHEKPSRTARKRKRELETTIYWEAWKKLKRPTIFKTPSTKPSR